MRVRCEYDVDDQLHTKERRSIMFEDIPDRRKPVEIFLDSQHQPFKFDTMAEAIGWMSIVNKLEKRIDSIDSFDVEDLEGFVVFLEGFLNDTGVQFIYNSGLPIELSRKVRFVCWKFESKGTGSMQEVLRSFRGLGDYNTRKKPRSK